MKEKFKSNKLKQNLLLLTIFIAIITVIFVASSLLKENNNVSPNKKYNKPDVKYMDKKEQESSSFRQVYGDELIKLKNKQKELDRKMKELDNLISKNKISSTNTNSSENMGLDNLANTVLSDLDIKVPPINEIEPNSRTPKKNRTTQKNKNIITEIIVKDDLLVIDDSDVPSEMISNKNYTNKGNSNSIEDKKTKKNDKNFILPATTFVKGILINGLDAPTTGRAKEEPHPVAIRIIDDAILPNHFKSDIKECRAMASAYGDLSSERAIIRVESVTCMKNNGEIYSSKGKSVGYVTGEDGKIGLAGRVVSKQGAILARTLLAGFVEGVGEMVKASSQSVSASANGTVTQIDPDKAFKAGMYNGLGNTGKKLSDYYLKLNDQMFPIVEINLGRKCDLIFSKPVKMEKVSNDK